MRRSMLGCLVLLLAFAGDTARADLRSAPPEPPTLTVTGIDPLDTENPGPIGCSFGVAGGRNYDGLGNTTDFYGHAESSCVHSLTLAYLDATASVPGATAYGTCPDELCLLPAVAVAHGSCPGLCTFVAKAYGTHTAIARSATFIWAGYDPLHCWTGQQVIPGVGIGSAITCRTSVVI